MSDAYDPVTEGGKHSRALDATFASNWQGVFKEVDLDLIPRAGQVHLALLEAEEFVGLALRKWAAGRGDAAGSEELAGRLAALQIRLNEHRAGIEAEGSLSDSVKSEDPWLISQLQHLLRHHDKLGSAILLASAEYEIDPERIRAAARLYRRAKGMAAELTTLLSVERSLVMAQFCEPQAQD